VISAGYVAPPPPVMPRIIRRAPASLRSFSAITVQAEPAVFVASTSLTLCGIDFAVSARPDGFHTLVHGHGAKRLVLETYLQLGVLRVRHVSGPKPADLRNLALISLRLNAAGWPVVAR
jgi:hypothetical protein